VLTAAVREHVRCVAAPADLVLFVVSATEGILPMDSYIADLLSKCGANAIAIANNTRLPCEMP
jgi:predicted GTPase